MKPIKNGNNNEELWYDRPHNEAHETIAKTNDDIESNSKYRYENYLLYLKTYLGRDISGLDVFNHTRYNDAYFKEAWPAFNIGQSICDTLANNIFSNKTKVMYMTENATATERQRTIKKNKVLNGILEERGYYEKAPDAGMDGLVFGLGALKFYIDGAEVKIDRSYPWEFNFIDAQAAYGELYELFQVRFVPRQTLLRKCKHDKKLYQAIKSCTAEQMQFGKKLQRNYDMIKIYEAYRLPLYESKIENGKYIKELVDPGRHVVCLNNVTLNDEEWNIERFPYEFFKPNKPRVGFFGQSEIEKLIGKQMAINVMNLVEEEAFEMCSAPWVLTEENSNVNVQQMQNVPGTNLGYRGIKPEIYTPTPISPMVLQRREGIKRDAFEEHGVSQLSASSKNPLGANASGRALEEYKDSESMRFALLTREYDMMAVGGAEIIMALYKKIAEDNDGDFEIAYFNSESISRVMFSELFRPDEKELIRPFPTNYFAGTPSAKFRQLDELIQRGWIDKINGMRLADFPDIKSVTSLETAGADYIDNVIANFLDESFDLEEAYVAPDPHAPLELGIKMMTAAYLRANTDGLEDERLGLFRRWITGAMTLLKPPEEAMPPPPSPEEMMAGAQAAPPGMQMPQDPAAMTSMPAAPMQ